VDFHHLVGAAVNPAEVIAEARAYAESIMTDTLRVTRATLEPVTDPNTGVVTYPNATVYEGKGRIQSRATEAKRTEGEGQDFTLEDSIAQLPISVPLSVDDEIEVTASALDSLNVGTVYRVVSVDRKTHATMCRAGIEEVSS
jgi:hypothetical protein